MEDNEQKCGFAPCSCAVPRNERYCCAYCEEAADETYFESSNPLRCGCQHEGCCGETVLDLDTESTPLRSRALA